MQTIILTAVITLLVVTVVGLSVLLFVVLRRHGNQIKDLDSKLKQTTENVDFHIVTIHNELLTDEQKKWEEHNTTHKNEHDELIRMFEEHYTIHNEQNRSMDSRFDKIHQKIKDYWTEGVKTFQKKALMDILEKNAKNPIENVMNEIKDFFTDKSKN